MIENTSTSEIDPKEQEKKDVLRILQETAEFIIQNKIYNLVLVDRGMRPLAATLRAYFDSTDFAEKYGIIYTDLKKPFIFFINPWGFLNKEDHGVNKAWKKYEDGMGKFDEGLEYPNRIKETPGDVVKDLESHHPYLISNKNQPTLIVDTCAHSGDALTPILNTFELAGFTNLKVEVISEPDVDSGIQADLSIFTDKEKQCKPFGNHYSVRKTFDAVISKPAKINDSETWKSEDVKAMLTGIGMLPLPPQSPYLQSRYKNEEEMIDDFKERVKGNAKRAHDSFGKTSQFVKMIRHHFGDISED